MGLKSFKEIISVDATHRICDLCEVVLPPGSRIIQVSVAQVSPDGAIFANYVSRTPDSTFDICSVDCLTKNLDGLSMLLNVKGDR